MDAEVSELERLLKSKRKATTSGSHATAQEKVDAAMGVFDDITRITSDDQARGEINSMITKLGMRLGLNFSEGIKGKKCIVRRLVGGVMTFGDECLPVPLFGALNAKSIEGSKCNEDGGGSHASDQGGPRGLADKDVLVQGNRLERIETETDLSSSSASNASSMYA